MVVISDFVRGTLTYLSNCFIAVVTLLFAAIKLRPIPGALRCKARHGSFAAETPDSRVLLFISCCCLGSLLTHALSNWGEALVELATTVLGSTKLDRTAIVISAAVYFTCEWSLARATSRAQSPGRRGRRNRQILRFVVAALLLQLTVNVIVANWALAALDKASWSSFTGLPPSQLGRMADYGLWSCKLLLVVIPPAYLMIALSCLPRHRLVADGPWPLTLLPLNLVVAALAAALLLWLIYPANRPRLADLRCAVSPGLSGATLTVEAVFVNPSDQWWRPDLPLSISVEGGGKTDPRTGVTPHFIGGGSTIGIKGSSGFDPLLVAPNERTTMHREIVLEESPSSVTKCWLTNSYPGRTKDFLSILFGRVDDWETTIDWKEVTPAENLEGTAEMMPPATNASTQKR